MKLAASFILHSAFGATTNNRECPNLEESALCENRCVSLYSNCIRFCDGDSTCNTSCGRTQVDCENSCPCNSKCPNGCPCPNPTTFCNKCETAECLGFADAVLNKMDQTANPCDDFDRYVCGKWRDESEIPSDSGSYTQFNVVRKDLSSTLKRVLEDADSDSETSTWISVQKAKKFYSNCMDIGSINAMSNQQLREEISIGWPSMGVSESGMSVYNSVVQGLTKYGISAIFSADQDLDNDDSNKWIIDLGHPRLGMSQSYYTTENEADRIKYRDAYVNYIVTFCKYYRSQYDDISTSDNAIEEMALDIYKLERLIAQNMWTSVENRDPANRAYKKPLDDVTTNSIVSDWSQFLNDIFAELKVSGINTTGQTIVNNSDKKWFAAVDTTLEEAGIGDGELMDYVAWRVHQSVIPYLGDEWRATADEFNQIVSGTTEKERWQTCSDATQGSMEWPVGKLYIDEDFSPNAKVKCEEMIDDLQHAFREQILDDATWMSPITKIKAREKLEKMTINVAYPDWINDQATVDAKYETFEVQDGNYIGTRLSGRRWESAVWWSMLQEGGIVDKEMWLTGPAIVNAFYSSSFNSITFPAGILQPPFFDEFQTTAMNFGGIGVVIGHEITHGFDDQGSKYDGDGNYNNWWAEQDLANFNGRVQCIKDEYAGFFFEEAQMYLNGDLTAGENTADNGGLYESFYGYNNWQDKENNDIHIPKLSDQYDEKQLFFINYGQIWCSNYRPEYAVWLASNDPHSPGEFRTNGAVQNHPSFGRIFGCKKGKDALFPENYCRVW